MASTSSFRSFSASIWVKNAGSRSSLFPRLSSTGGHFDVCVIGGGVVGVSTAHALKSSGKRVALIEARQLGYGITGYSTAKMTSQQGLIYSKIAKKHGKEAARLYGEMQEKAIADTDKLVKQLNLQCEWERRSHLTWTPDATSISDVEQEASIALDIGLPCTLLKSMEQIELPKSIGIKAAVEFKNQAQFNSYKYCVELGKHVDGDGSKVYEETRVLDVSSSSPHRVTCENGTSVDADQVVLATHLPILDRSMHFAMLTPSRAHCIAFTLTDNNSMVHAMSINAGSPERSLRSTCDDSVVVLAGESVKQGDDPDTRDRYNSLEQWARTHFPVKEILCKWSAMDYWSSDLLPYIGYLHRGTNTLFCATGFGKWGLANGVAAASIIRDLIFKQDNKFHSLVDARRWDLHALPGALEENIHTGKHFVADKVKALIASDIKTLKPGEGGLVKHKGETLGVYMDPDGKYHAVNPVCTHLGCHLLFNSGDKVWDCPCHGSQFDIHGQVIHGPACKALQQKHLEW